MPTFKYVAKDQDAKTVAGKIAADNQSFVIEELRKRRLTIISIEEDKKAPGAKGAPQKRGKKVKSEDLVIFSRQMATMVDAGIPIVQALEALHDQTTNPTFKKVIATMRDDIHVGSSLSAAFAKHPKIFDSLYCNMIKVGESGGVLATILERISQYLEKTARLVRKVQAALVYPSVIVCMACLITLILLVKVVPTFAGIYESFGRELPLPTRILIGFSNVLRTQLWLAALVVGGAGFLLYRFQKTERGARAIDQFKLKMPIFGDLICKVAISRFSRTLSTLMQSGVPILESLEIVGKSCGNKIIEAVIVDVRESVRKGEGIAEPLGRSDVFPPMVTRMIAIGEKSGQMEKMLNKIAEFYDDQVDASVSALTSLIEPLIIGFLGIVVGSIVIALFMPIINITQIIQ